jgi:hypothetical protein
MQLNKRKTQVLLQSWGYSRQQKLGVIMSDSHYNLVPKDLLPYIHDTHQSSISVLTLKGICVPAVWFCYPLALFHFMPALWWSQKMFGRLPL